MSLRAEQRRRRLSMTSLIDVIFLLLLFFMLSSTFSRFAEVELRTSGRGSAVNASDTRTLFLQVSDAGLVLNGQAIDKDRLKSAFAEDTSAANLLVSISPATSAQTLTDTLLAVRPFPNLAVSVLEPS